MILSVIAALVILAVLGLSAYTPASAADNESPSTPSSPQTWSSPSMRRAAKRWGETAPSPRRPASKADPDNPRSLSGFRRLIAALRRRIHSLETAAMEPSQEQGEIQNSSHPIPLVSLSPACRGALQYRTETLQPNTSPWRDGWLVVYPRDPSLAVFSDHSECDANLIRRVDLNHIQVDMVATEIHLRHPHDDHCNIDNTDQENAGAHENIPSDESGAKTSLPLLRLRAKSLVDAQKWCCAISNASHVPHSTEDTKSKFASLRRHIKSVHETVLATFTGVTELQLAAIESQ